MEPVFRLLKTALLPPFGLFLIIGIGWLVMPWRRRLGRALFAVGLVALYLLSTPYVGSLLLGGLQVHKALALNPPVQDIGAIVVLGAGVYREAPEYGAETPDSLTLARIRYGAKLHRDLGLPLLVTGGSVRPTGRPVGVVMQESLEQDFVVPVKWVETESKNTFENAKSSSQILGLAGITKVYLVTHAWHMRRAKGVFEAAGLQVVPAPMGFVSSPGPELGDFVANPAGLVMSYYAVYEGVGLLWYALNGYL